MTHDALSRRNALAGAAVAGVGLPLLAACGGDDPSPSNTRDTASPSAGASGGSTPSGDSGGEVVATTADVAVGACAVFADSELVVTQPTEGEFRCFSAICTHQGCLVSSSSDGVIPCTCHASEFSLEDGSVLDGPAEAPLQEVPVTVDGDRIVRT